jgi:transposase InsO family protein
MNWSATKSSDQRSFGSFGTRIGARLPNARLRPLRRRRLHVLLRREGFKVNHKRLFRLYREERLMVR